MVKRLAFVLALSILSALALAPAASAQERSDVLVMGMATSDIISLDPAKAFEFSGTGIVTQTYDRLVDFPAGRFDKPEPSLAESWKVSEDGKVWTFKLRQDVKFHSGNPLTAEDVVYSFARVVVLKDQPAFILNQFGITKDSIKALDKHTVEITLDKKYAGGIFLACLTAAVSSVVDSQVVKQHVTKTDKYPEGDMGLTWLSRNSAGCGSFILRTWDKNDRVILDYNPKHFRDVPKVKRVVIKEINEAASRRLQVEKGDLDIAWALLPDQVKELKANKDVRVQAVTATYIVYLGLNVTKTPLNDNRVRQAIRYALDYQGIVDSILGGAAKPINTFIPEGFAGYENVRFYDTNLDKAKALLKEAGLAEGFEISLDHHDATPMPELAQAIQNSLARVGIKVKLNKMISAQLWPKYRAQKHDLVLAQWGPDYSDPHTNAQPFADCTAKQLAHRNVYCNDKTTKLIQDAAQEMDNDKRLKMYQEANKIIQEEGPYAFLYQPVYLHAVRRNVEDFFPGPTFGLTKLCTVVKK